MINTFLIEGEILDVHDDSVDILVDNHIKMNISMTPVYIEIVNEIKEVSLSISIQGRLILDKENNLKLFTEKLSYERAREKTKSKEYER